MGSTLHIEKDIKRLERRLRTLECVFGCLKEYDSHEDAAAGGVSVGQVFIASDTNTMGLTPSALVVRKELA